MTSRNKNNGQTPIHTQGQHQSIPDLFYCKKHINSPIQYYCETDSTALCSQCNLLHLKRNHLITMFTPKSIIIIYNIEAVLITEIDWIAKSIEEEIKYVNRQASSLDLIKKNIINHHSNQLQLITSSTEKLMQSILKQKFTIQIQLNKHFNQQIEEIEAWINANSQIKSDLSQYKLQCKELKNKLGFYNEEKIYNDIDDKKKAMIMNWEHSRICFKTIKIDFKSKIKDNAKQKGVKINADYSQLVFELIDQEVNLLSQVGKAISNQNLRCRLESIGSVKIASDSIKEVPISNNKDKRISNPNVNPQVFKLIPQLRQSQSQRVIG